MTRLKPDARREPRTLYEIARKARHIVWRKNIKKERELIKVKNLFEGTPFNSYTDVVNSIKTGNAKFSYWRSAAYNVATSINKMAFFTYFLGFILSVVAIIVLSFLAKNYWILFFIPILFFLNIYIHKLKGLVVICVLVSIIGFFWGMKLWLLSLFVSIVALQLGYSIWWALTTSIVSEELLNNEELFSKMWENRVLAIRDNAGNFYVNKIEI